jgi:hypothetical protein
MSRDMGDKLIIVIFIMCLVSATLGYIYINFYDIQEAHSHPMLKNIPYLANSLGQLNVRKNVFANINKRVSSHMDSVHFWQNARVVIRRVSKWQRKRG